MHSNEFVVMTAKVVHKAARRKLVHLPVDKSRYYEKNQFGETRYVGTFKSDKEARAVWLGHLRSEGAIA